MITIGLTGNISCGKSTVSRYLADIGATIIDADLVSRDIVQPGTPALRDIIDYFGPDVLDSNGYLDRKQLGTLVFTNPKAMAVLNSITHPRIIEAIEHKKREHAAKFKNSNSVLVIDAPLLIETGLHKSVDEIWVVTIDPHQQIKRLMQRDGISEIEAQKKVAAQMPQQEKAKYAHRTIDNNGTPTETITQVKQHVKSILGLEQESSS